MENSGAGDLKTFNAAKEIAHFRDLQLIMNYVNATHQARTGSIPGKTHHEMTDQEKKLNRVRGLMAMIHAQRELIQLSRYRVKRKSYVKWSKLHKTTEEQEGHPLELEDNDYTKLKRLQELLIACEKDILEADITPSVKDDFIVKKDMTDGEQWDLTENFYEMLEALEDNYEELEGIMYENEIISAGLVEDEELTYKEQEQAFIDRVKEA